MISIRKKIAKEAAATIMPAITALVKGIIIHKLVDVMVKWDERS